MTAITTAQLRAIHATSRRVGLSDDERRTVISAVAGGKTSCKALTSSEAIRVLDALNGRNGAGGLSSLSRADKAEGPWRAKLQALWLSGWHLGVVRDRRDSAMHAFIRRPTHNIDHSRFLIEAAEANKAIEAIKALLAREGGVEWPKRGGSRASKLAVLDALARRLDEAGLGPIAVGMDLSEEEIDDKIRDGGARLRKALKGGGNGR